VVAGSTLDSLLAYLGYAGRLTADGLRVGEPRVLMDTFPGGEVLVTRFFAPKITDVSGRDPEPKLGWRKLVRLRALGGSPADARGITTAFLLFNVLQLRTEVAQDPFAGRPSVTNQVMLIPAAPAPGGPKAYWIVYDQGYQLTDHLEGTFDGGDYSGWPAGPVRPYYVPAACGQCHGGSENREALNYLDTDHWHDRVQAGDDFADVDAAGHGVVFDGGRDTTTPRFRTAFDVIRQLNREIRDQNRVAVGDYSFQYRAVDSWLDRHETDVRYLATIDRPIPGVHAWTPGAAPDDELLPILNRYCYRCHSSVRYHVFDRDAVADPRRRARMIDFIRETDPKKVRMPQDRELKEPIKEQLIRLLNALRP
jgi:hypothetical protein